MEAEEARAAAARANTVDDFRPHVIVLDQTGPHGFRCEVCNATVGIANRARMMRRPCPGPPENWPVPSAEVEAHRKFERERKREYLTRKKEARKKRRINKRYRTFKKKI